MTLWDKIIGEFVDIIEWTDDTRDTLVWRFPRYQNEIKYSGKLVVRETQLAVFVSSGKIADVFNPGMYTLVTENLPVLSTLQGWAYGFNSPFKAEVYFINTRNFVNLKWGTKNAIMLRDEEFGPVRLRAFGTYIIKIIDPTLFIRQIVGTNARFSIEDICEQLRSMISSSFADILAESHIPILDLSANYEELASFVTSKIKAQFQPFGLDITKMVIENISLPPEVEAALDKKSSMGIIGDLSKYTQYQSASAMEKAAENPGGEASAGIGMGMGFAMANQLSGQVGQTAAPAQNTAPVQPGPPPLPGQAQSRYYVAVQGTPKGPFEFGNFQKMAQDGQIAADSLVWKTGLESWVKASQLEDLKPYFDSVPPPLP